jgi:hypothetical protein
VKVPESIYAMDKEEKQKTLSLEGTLEKIGEGRSRAFSPVFSKPVFY